MKQVNGFWLPRSEAHLISFLERGPMFAGGATYQLHKLIAALPHIKNFRAAIDVGAHCGLWSRPLAAIFGKVFSFEPVPAHIECFVENLRRSPNIQLFKVALGDHEGMVNLHTSPSSSGDTYVKADGEHTATMTRLDSFEWNDVDFIKIDCEGFEKFVLMGGEETIRHFKPCIIVEQKPGKGSQFGLGDQDAVTLLKKWGADCVEQISGDFIMRWK